MAPTQPGQPPGSQGPPFPPPPQQGGPQPPPLVPIVSDPFQANPGTLTPPGMFISPAGLPRRVPQQQAAQAQPPPAPSALFPSTPGAAVPGAATPGQPAQPQPPSPAAGPYLIGEQADPAGSATTIITAIRGTTTGSGTVVAVSCPSATPTGVTDTAGNTYTLGASDPGGNQPTWAWVALNTTALAAGDTITVTWSATAGAKNALAVTVPGAKTASAVDATATADGASTTPSATTGPLASDQETAIAVISSGNAGGQVSWAAPWAVQGTTVSGTTQYTSIATRPTSAATPVIASGTLGASTGWTTVVVTLELVPVPVVVQSTGAVAVSEYGINSVEMTTTEGNALVVLAGWGLGPHAGGPMPRVDVSDSAGNYWVPLATSPAAGAGSRCAAWICANAMALGSAARSGWVSVSVSAFASSLAYTVLEISGMPSLVAGDVSVTSFTNSGTALSESGTAATSGVAFAMVAAGTTAVSVTVPPAGWTPLAPREAGAALPGAQVAYPNWIKIFPYWMPASSAGTLSASWTLGPGAYPLSGLLVSIQGNPTAPSQPNPDMPVLAVEAGFGYLPGDPSQPPPAWTDITASTMGKSGEQYVAWSYGRQYELSTPEAGTLAIGVNNLTGDFTPGNSASPYAPLRIGIPVRVRAWWAGRWYHVAYGYVERWPTEFPDLPQWGLSKMTATDGVAVMNSTPMPSALQGDILADAPYALLPGSEQYLSFSTGISATGNFGFYTYLDPQGLPAVNLSRTSQREGFYTDGSAGLIAQTGQALNLLGENGTGFGTSSATGSEIRGPGLIYADPGMPHFNTSTGFTLEIWFIANTTTATTLFTAYPAPSPYNLTSFMIEAVGSVPALVIWLPGTGAWKSVPLTLRSTMQQCVISVTSGVLSLYLNGALAGIWGLPDAAKGDWTAAVLGCARYAWGTQPFVGNYTAAYLTIYGYALPPARVHSHYQAGFTGGTGDIFPVRAAKILTWGYLGLPRGGPITFAGSAGDVFCGAAYSISGGNAASAVNTFMTGDGGVYVSMPSGVLTVLPRWWLNNIPVTAAFGDATDGSEVPYLPGQAFDYDNTYLTSESQASQTAGPNQGITVAVKDATSQREYFTRSNLSQQLQTTSNYDVYDAASLGLANYSQPGIRNRGLTVDAASNPSVFTTILTHRVADVATVTRRPVGGAVITTTVIAQKVSGEIGPGLWRVTYQHSPYTLQNAILTLDETGYNVVGSNNLGA